MVYRKKTKTNQRVLPTKVIKLRIDEEKKRKARSNGAIMEDRMLKKYNTNTCNSKSKRNKNIFFPFQF